MGKKSRSKKERKMGHSDTRSPEGVWVQRMVMLNPENLLRVQIAATPDGLKRLKEDLIGKGLLAEEAWPVFADQFTLIPWQDFLMGCISGSAAKQIDIIWFEHDGDQMLPLTQAGFEQVAHEGQTKWQGLTPQECNQEITRIVLSLKMGVQIPNLRDFIAGASQGRHPTQKGVIAHIGDPAELRRKANFGIDHWDNNPGDGTYLVKVQRPLLGTDPLRLEDGVSFLVYNQDKSLLMLLNNRAQQAQLRDMMGSNVKVYVRATLTGKVLSFDPAPQLSPDW